MAVGANLPETTCVRIVGYAGKHQRGGSVGQRAVNDIRVTGDPADVSGAPECLAVLIVENVLVGNSDIQQIAAGRVQHAFGLARGTGGIKNEQGILRVHLFRRAVRGSLFHQLVIPDVAFVLERHLCSSALHHDHRVNIGAGLQSLIRIGFERHRSTASGAFISSHHDTAIGIEDAVP
jgi:hypothetical protein